MKDFTWLYDVDTDVWTECQPKIHPPKGAPGNDHLSLRMVWHDASGTILLLQNATESATDNKTWPPAELWSFDVATAQWAPVPVDQNGLRPAFLGLLAYDRKDDLLVLFGGGRDGTDEAGSPVARPAHSRQVWTCRVRIDGTKPAEQATPERISATVDRKQVTLDWPAEPGREYHVYRAAAEPLVGGHTRVTAAPIRGGRYVDRTAAAGKVYAYQVAAVGSARRSLPAFNQPWRPGGLLASVESANEVRLHWRPENLADLAGYRVYRAAGPLMDQGIGELLTPSPIGQPHFTDTAVDLSDGMARAYWVTAVNRGGIESGASPLAYTFPDAPGSLAVPEGTAPSDGVGDEIAYLVSWSWPNDVKVAGFDVYHATEHIDTLLADGGYDRFWTFWKKLNDQPVTGRQFIFSLPKDGPRNHYFYVRAVNVLGQAGFYTDIVSPTDRRFRP